MSAYSHGELHVLTAIGRQFVVATADTASHSHYDAIRQLLHQVREALGMDVAFVSEFVDGHRVFRCVDAAPRERVTLTEGQGEPLAQSYCQRVVDGRLAQAIPDAMADAAALEIPATRDLRIGAHLSVPIVLANGTVFGTLCCFSHRAQPLAGADAAALSALAELIAAGIDKSGTLRDTLWLRGPGDDAVRASSRPTPRRAGR